VTVQSSWIYDIYYCRIQYWIIQYSILKYVINQFKHINCNQTSIFKNIRIFISFKKSPTLLTELKYCFCLSDNGAYFHAIWLGPWRVEKSFFHLNLSQVKIRKKTLCFNIYVLHFSFICIKISLTIILYLLRRHVIQCKYKCNFEDIEY